MFRKRQKKIYPQGTFIPTPARICAIVQLCLAFSLFLWIASEPFVGEIFTLKSKQLFYQDVMGIPSKDNLSQEAVARLERNSERYKALSKKQQYELKQSYQSLQKQLQRSFWDKLTSMVALFVYRTSPYELAWIFFSIIVSIMLLKKVEGAAHAVWLLPVLVAVYAVDARWFNPKEQRSPDAALFPTENELVENYLDEKLNDDIFEQHNQLMKGWKKYLVVNWTQKEFSSEITSFENQVEEGEFNFTLARIETSNQQSNTKYQSAIWLLVVYFFWNSYFAYTGWKNTND
jgi:hypothetical protein